MDVDNPDEAEFILEESLCYGIEILPLMYRVIAIAIMDRIEKRHPGHGLRYRVCRRDTGGYYFYVDRTTASLHSMDYKISFIDETAIVFNQYNSLNFNLNDPTAVESIINMPWR